MINISELINDPDFSQSFVIHRYRGSWTDGGRFETTEELLYRNGIILPEGAKEMRQVIQGDMIHSMIDVYLIEPIYTTVLADQAWEKNRVSDQIEYKGELWKVMQVAGYQDFGYYKATCTRILGA